MYYKVYVKLSHANAYVLFRFRYKKLEQSMEEDGLSDEQVLNDWNFY